MHWTPPPKPAELTEHRLLQAILDGQFPIDSNLPAERELAALLGVTRPTLRETLQRLARDGWLEIRHGKPTRVRNYWVEGNLAVLAHIARRQDHLPQDFIPNLLSIRCLLAPAYTRLAIHNDAESIAQLLATYPDLADTPEAYTQADWELHRSLTIASRNPVFTLILNGFCELYAIMGKRYFALPAARAYSQQFYQKLLDCARQADEDAAETLTRQVMAESMRFWQQVSQSSLPKEI
ncbi:MAG: fatty acid metabolism transcriptional regulator FadR [Anaerolineae bacterium]|nr:fatty acid metabolism transcriptional regulator FadR [Anaerolineae bacterium]